MTELFSTLVIIGKDVPLQLYKIAALSDTIRHTVEIAKIITFQSFPARGAKRAAAPAACKNGAPICAPLS